LESFEGAGKKSSFEFLLQTARQPQGRRRRPAPRCRRATFRKKCPWRASPGSGAAPFFRAEPAVSCLEDKPKEWDVPGKYGCKQCRATSDKKKKLCKPAKVDKKK
jgi:hypothetical protein